MIKYIHLRKDGELMITKEIQNIYENLLIKYDNKMNLNDSECNRNCTCCKGCESCCYQLIIITEFEFDILKNRVNEMTRNQKKQLSRIVKEQCDILSKNNITPETVTPYLNERNQEFVQSTFFNLNLQCPFLKDKACSVHSTRPMSCFTYRNYGSSEDCTKSIHVPEAYTFNNIEIELRNDIQNNTGIYPQGFYILQYALKEIV